jgi:hypothetical protein
LGRDDSPETRENTEITVGNGVDDTRVEAAALEWFAEFGYRIGHALTPDTEHAAAEQRGYPLPKIPAQT